jgi:hypothetical protein
MNTNKISRKGAKIKMDEPRMNADLRRWRSRSIAQPKQNRVALIIRVNLRSSAVRLFVFFVPFCGYSYSVGMKRIF